MTYVVEEVATNCDAFAMRFTDTTDDSVNELVAKDYGDNFRWDGDEDQGSTGSDYWACRRGSVVTSAFCLPLPTLTPAIVAMSAAQPPQLLTAVVSCSSGTK
eukprot:2301929-Rhodomonas_salina.9